MGLGCAGRKGVSRTERETVPHRVAREQWETHLNARSKSVRSHAESLKIESNVTLRTVCNGL